MDDSKITKDSKVNPRNNYSICNSCKKENEIVFDKEGFKLCNECLDEFMKEHRFTK